LGLRSKAAKGKQSHHQKEFQRELEGAGGKYLLAFDLDDVIEDWVDNCTTNSAKLHLTHQSVGRIAMPDELDQLRLLLAHSHDSEKLNPVRKLLFLLTEQFTPPITKPTTRPAKEKNAA
jgi:hypothetical protein